MVYSSLALGASRVELSSDTSRARVTSASQLFKRKHNYDIVLKMAALMKLDYNITLLRTSANVQ